MNYSRIVFIRHLGWGITLPVTVIWQLQRGLSLEQVGLITSLALIFQLIIELPSGYLADRLGRARIITLGGLLHAASVILFAYAHSPLFFLIAALLQAAGWACISGADEALLYDHAQVADQNNDFKNTLSKVSFADESGTLLGFIASVLLIHFLSIQLSLVCAATFLLLSFLVSIISLSDTAARIPVPNSVINTTGLNHFFHEHKKFLLFSVAFAFLYEAGRILWQPQFIHLGFQPDQVSTLYVGLGVFSILGAYLAGHHLVKSTLPTLLILACIQVVLFTLFATGKPVVAIGSLGLYVCLEKIKRVIQSDWINQAVTSSLRATFLSLNNITRTASGAAFAFLLGATAQKTLSYGFISLISISLLGTVFLGVLSVATLRADS